MARLFGRAFQVTAWRPPIGVFSDTGSAPVDALIIREHRVQFSVEKSTGSEPNKAEVRITNLAKSTRTELCRKPMTVQLAAGYENATRYIFSGDVRDGRVIPSSTETETVLLLGDGDRAYRHARVNRAYKVGTSVLKAVRDAAASMGFVLPRKIEVSPELQRQFSAGVTLYGASRDELTRLLAPYGYSWSIQSGQLQILKDSETREDRAWPINVENGMIGSPEWSSPTSSGEAPKLTVQSLLYPELTPGGKVQVASKEVNGIFRIVKVTHTGDTHGDEWATTIEAKA